MRTEPVSSLPDNWPVMSIEQANALLTAPGAVFEMEELSIHGSPVNVYKNAPASLRDLFEAGSTGFADKTLMVFQDERVSFAAHRKAVRKLAEVLKTQFGLRQGDRVAISMRNYPQWSVGFWACLISGYIATPLNSWWTGEELEYGLSDSGAKVAIVDDEIFSRIAPHWQNLPNLEQVIVARGEGNYTDDRVHSMEQFIGAAPQWESLELVDAPEIDLKPEDEATIMYSSGTTGKPKGILATHRAIIANMFNSMANQVRALLRRGETPPEPNPEDPQKATLVSIPLFHATGSFAILSPCFITGNKIVTMYKWDATEALGIIEREKITAFGGVPAIAWQVLEHPDRDKYDLSSIEAVSYGGAPSAPELVATIKRRFKDAVAGNGWGMTETCATATLNLAEDYVNRPESAGAPAPAVELKVVDTDGKTLPPNEIGELWCKSPSNAKCYWNRPESTAETFKDGWVVTGDLARIDEDGFLYLVDRAKDMLIRGGENIYCIEVESALYDHPDITDAAVVGIPHKVLGEEVGAVVQVKDGSTLTLEPLQAFLKEHLAGFKIPVRVEFQSEPLPRNANGKILKAEIRERFSQPA